MSRGEKVRIFDLQRDLMAEDLQEERGAARQERGAARQERGRGVPMTRGGDRRSAYAEREPGARLGRTEFGGPPPWAPVAKSASTRRALIAAPEPRFRPYLAAEGASRFIGPTATAGDGAGWEDYAEDSSDNPERVPPPPEGPGLRTDRGLGIDIHEVLKAEAFQSQQAACDDHFEKSRPCPSGVYGVSDQYIVLDSFQKIRESRTEQGEFQWNFMVQGVTGDQVIGIRDKADTIIEAQMAGFIFPMPPEVPYVLTLVPITTPSGLNKLVLIQNNSATLGQAPTLVLNVIGSGLGQYPPSVLTTASPSFAPIWVNNPYTQLPFGGRLTVQMKEAGLQSYSDRNGARHHFEFIIAYISAATGQNPTMLQALPLTGTVWDTYTFTDPLKDIHGLTLVFRNPDVPIKFDPDCYYEVRVTSDGAVPPGPYLMFNVPNHGLNAGDRIFVQGFKSGVGVLDSYVNRAEGHAINGQPTGVPGTGIAPGVPLASVPSSVDAFWLDPAVSIIDLAPAPVLPQVVTVCVAKRRIRIPMRLRRVVARLTNYVAP
jgi:hypothetical protein